MSPFPTTRWTLIAHSTGDGSSDAREAFGELCGAYWYPLFAYLRRKGEPADRAADLVQGLFVSLLQRESLDTVDRERGKFRTWLITALQNHASDVRDHERALKRGGGAAHFPLDVEDAEGRYLREPADVTDPQALFDRAWAEEVLRQALDRVRDEYRDRGRASTFELLSPTLEGEELDREGVCHALRLSPVALRVAIHRLRGRYREQVLAEVADTLGPGEEPGREAALLMEALGQPESPLRP